MRTLAKKIFYLVQNVVSVLLFPMMAYMNRTKPQARILMYHSVGPFPKETSIPYDNVPADVFEHQMAILKQKGYNLVSLTELVHQVKTNAIRPKTICLTFDDGFKNNYDYALPILKKYKFPSVFFVITGAIGETEPYRHLPLDEKAKQHCQKDPNIRLPMSVTEIQDLVAEGMEIGSHGMTHKSIGHLPSEEARRELEESKKILEKICNRHVKWFSYPFGAQAYGDYNHDTGKMLKEKGYGAACVTEIGPVTHMADLFELSRLPIRESDKGIRFECKLAGAFDWVNAAKTIFQTNLKRIDHYK